jgi:hypothetical protein
MEASGSNYDPKPDPYHHLRQQGGTISGRRLHEWMTRGFGLSPLFSQLLDRPWELSLPCPPWP